MSTRLRAAEALLPRYLEHRRRDAAAIRLALEVGEFSAVARIGHNLRGNAASFGFPELAGLGEALERAALHRDEAAVGTELAALERWVRGAVAAAPDPPRRPESGTRVRAQRPDPPLDPEDDLALPPRKPREP